MLLHLGMVHIKPLNCILYKLAGANEAGYFILGSFYPIKSEKIGLLDKSKDLTTSLLICIYFLSEDLG